MKKHSYLLIASGSALWGLIGIFIKALSSAGFTSMEITTIRAIAASVILFSYMALCGRPMLKIKFTDIKYFLATGILSMVFFNWCYFTAMRETSLSIAVVLLYTAPAFVIVISRFVFKEIITGNKILALILTASGSFLAAGLLPGMNIQFPLYGIIAGLGSGLGYALYSIFAKLAGRRYSPITITAYTFLTAAVFLLIFNNPAEKMELLLRRDILLYCAGLGLIPTSFAYILYTTGLKNVEAGKAAIVANIEPAVAILMGTMVFGEILTLPQIAGTVLILGSVIIVQLDGLKFSKEP
ncbi:MAG TPA: EamA family transporter [Spirochaetota bacterium]|nr:EamA family transporter [Spirochaetota bacterium]HPS87688.1 EamA family transporter [Spirochaetota bacterium]